MSQISTATPTTADITTDLGKKSHWDSVYALEQRNYSRNSADLGESWYDDESAEERIAQFVCDHWKPGHTGGVCDLGTGNGHMLFELAHCGLENTGLVGIDYSAQSVSFAKDIRSHGGQSLQGITFYESDFLKDDDQFSLSHRDSFGLVIDKGTLDAIYLSGTKYQPGNKSGVEIYASHVARIMKPDSVLIVTSCNFTEPELIAAVTKSGNFAYWTDLSYPVFEFGGHTGSAICTAAFKRV